MRLANLGMQMELEAKELTNLPLEYDGGRDLPEGLFIISGKDIMDVCVDGNWTSAPVLQLWCT